MKIKLGFFVIALMFAMTSLSTQGETETNADALGLPGDNLDLYATLDLFQKSKTIEEFEAALNDEKTGINNLDLDVNSEVDFIKVITRNEENNFTFVLQIDVLKNETQDVAVILVTKDKDDKTSIQIVGDEGLYGKDYIIEPKLETAAVTANPAYSGTAAVESAPASVVVVESQPIVRYVYSPVYVPYHPPYYYGYYPPYYHPFPVITLSIYFGRNRHHHRHYHGGHRGGNTIVINNNKSYNNYSKTRNTSNTVNRNKSDGKYKQNTQSKKPSKSTKMSTDKKKPVSKNYNGSTKNKSSTYSKPTTKPTTKPANRPKKKPASKPNNRPKRKK